MDPTPFRAQIRGPEGVLTPAAISERFVAYVLDVLPFGAGWALSLWAMLHSYSWPRRLTPPALVVFWVFLYVLYQFFGVLSGGTLGKRLMGIAVVLGDGRRPGPASSLLRALGQILSTPLLNLGFLVALVHPRSRTVHDLLSGTYVARLRPKNKAESAVLSLAAFCVLIFIYGFILYGSFNAPTPQDRLELKKAAAALMVVSRIEESYRQVHGSYADSLAELAAAAGDARTFKAAMAAIFDPDRFQIAVGPNAYRFSAVALNRARTRLILEGPPPRIHL